MATVTHTPAGSMPVIVGVPRSGTSLLRLMLDSHSQLAIPPETGFVPGCARLNGRGDRLRERFIHWITEYPPHAPGWADFGVSVQQLRGELESIDAFTVTAGLRAFYRLYALRLGKSRWGEKTPGYALEMREVAHVLPEAHFIHVIRDGRDVALSWRQTWFSPGGSMRTLARTWRAWIRRAREQSRLVPHYLEVRYERLVTDAEAVVRDVAAFVDLPFEPGMLDFHLRSRARLEEHGPRIRRDGQLIVSREMRLHQLQGTTRTLDSSRVGAWRSAMDERERNDFSRAAGDLLLELGYEI